MSVRPQWGEGRRTATRGDSGGFEETGERCMANQMRGEGGIGGLDLRVEFLAGGDGLLGGLRGGNSRFLKCIAQGGFGCGQARGRVLRLLRSRADDASAPVCEVEGEGLRAVQAGRFAGWKGGAGSVLRLR